MPYFPHMNMQMLGLIFCLVGELSLLFLPRITMHSLGLCCTMHLKVVLTKMSHVNNIAFCASMRLEIHAWLRSHTSRRDLAMAPNIPIQVVV